MKNILMLCSWFPNKVFPTNGNFIEKHIRLLQGRYLIQILNVEHDPALRFFEIRRETSITGTISTHLVYANFSNIKVIRNLGRILLMIYYTLTLYKKHRFSLIHVHIAMPGVLAALFLKWLHGIPIVLSVHSSGFLDIDPKQYSKSLRKLLVWAANQTSRVCPVSEALATAWIANGLKAPVTIIPNTVNVQIFSPKPKDFQKDAPIKLLHISNFHAASKNIRGLLGALLILQKRASF
ncbi:MAG: glycosyltransferase [Saprospiraceae bacterium]